MVRNRFYLAASLVTAAFLSACGQAEVAKPQGPPPEHGVFISTADCAEHGKISEDLCGKAIDMAIAAHRQQATVYKFATQCEAGEGGPDRCDKIGEGQYSVRVQAFYVVMSDPPVGVPLYPPKLAAAAFRSPSKQTISANDPSVHVSNDAQAVASENAKLKAHDEASGATLGDAAANIH
jgi:Protein of unknown function (DUF1190)